MNARAVLAVSLWLVSSVALGQTPPPPPPPAAYPAPAYDAARTPAYIPVPQAEPPPEPSLVRQNSVGPRFVIAPGVFIPSSGSAGFTLGVVGGYGFDIGPVILTPAVMFQGSWSSDWTVYSGLGGARVTVPLGNFGPFVELAMGYGHVGGPLGYSKGGVEVRVGGGFNYYFSRSFGLGVTVDYDSIVDTPYQTWIIAPTIMLSF